MIQIEVFGIPRPGGSKKPGRNRKTGKLFVMDANPNTAIWRSDVVAQSIPQYNGPLLTGPVIMRYEFRFPRPKNHYRTGNNAHLMREAAPNWHTIKPDLTKIIRSTEDALTGIVWQDDSQVCKRSESKRYCRGEERPGVTMFISEMKSAN